MDLETVIATETPVREVHNERAAFYLRNRELIEEWASVRSEAAREIAERVWDLAEPLQTDLVRLGVEDAHVAVMDQAKYPGVNLSRRAWQRQGSSPVTLSVTWEKAPLDNRGQLRIFTCVRAGQSHPDKEAWATPLAALGDELRVGLGSGWSRTPPRWIAWRYLALGDGSWTPETVARTARADLLRLWVTAAPLIDAKVRPI